MTIAATPGIGPVPGVAGIVSPLLAGGSRTRHFKLTGLNVNSAATDIGTFTGLPAKYAVRRLTLENASISLTLATIDLRTAAGGGGAAIVAAQSLAALTALAKLLDAAIAITDTQSAVASLIVRNVTPQGAAATVDATLEIEDLT